MRRHYFVIFALTLAIAFVLLPQARAQTSLASTAGTRAKFDVDYIPPSAVAIIAAYPRAVMMSKDLELLPREIISKLSMNNAGIDPVECEQVLVVVDALPDMPPPKVAYLAHFRQPIEQSKVLASFQSQMTDGTLDGRSYRKSTSPEVPSVYQADDRTLIIGSDDLLKKIVANHASPHTSKLSAMLSHVGTPDIVALVDVEALRPHLDTHLAQAQIPPPLAGLAKLPDLTQHIAAKVELTGDLNVTVTLRANDEAAAKQIDGIIEGLMLFGKQTLMQQLASQANSGDPIEKATAQYVKRVTDRLCEMFKPARTGATLKLAGSGKENFQRLVTIATGWGFFTYRDVKSVNGGPAAGEPGVQPVPIPDNRVR